jgi:hypothetical protein
VHEGKGGNTRKALLKGVYKDKTAHIKYIHGEDVRASIYGRCASINAIYHIKYIQGEDVRASIYGGCASNHAIYLRFGCTSRRRIEPQILHRRRGST